MLGCDTVALLNCLFLTQHVQVGTETGRMFERLSESCVFVHDAICLFMYALVFLSVFC